MPVHTPAERAKRRTAAKKAAAEKAAAEKARQMAATNAKKPTRKGKKKTA